MTGTLITVAPAGAEHSRADVPGMPVTSADLMTTAKECEALGAAVLHVHAGDRPDPGELRALVAAVHGCTDLIVQLSGAEVVIDAGAEMAVCQVGDAAAHTRMQESGVVPVYPIAVPEQLAGLQRLLGERGVPFGGHVHVELVMGAPGGMPATPAALVACESAIRDLPAGTTFSATGLDRGTLPVMLTSLAAGGHLRVGMRDTRSYAENRPVDSDMQLVARAVGFAQLAQRPPLTPAQARDLLGVPPR